MTKEEILAVLALVFIIPIGLYIRQQNYKGIYGNSTICQDLENLIGKCRQWRNEKRSKRELKEKYKHLNKRKRQ